MSKGEAPYFNFYTNDYLNDQRVMSMTPEEEAIYINLLCRAWNNIKTKGFPSLTSDLKKLKENLGKKFTVNKLGKFIAKYPDLIKQTEDGTEIYSPWLLEKYKEMNENKEKKSAAAQKANKVRWEKTTETDSETDSETEEKNIRSDIRSDSQSESESESKSELLKISSSSLPILEDKEEEEEEMKNINPEEEEHIPADMNLPCPYKEIIELYHKLMPANTRVTELTKELKTKIKNVWYSDKKRQEMRYYQNYFDYINRSDFLTGRDGKANKPFDFEYFMQIRIIKKIKFKELY